MAENNNSDLPVVSPILYLPLTVVKRPREDILLLNTKLNVEVKAFRYHFNSSHESIKTLYSRPTQNDQYSGYLRYQFRNFDKNTPESRTRLALDITMTIEKNFGVHLPLPHFTF